MDERKRFEHRQSLLQEVNALRKQIKKLEAAAETA